MSSSLMRVLFLLGVFTLSLGSLGRLHAQGSPADDGATAIMLRDPDMLRVVVSEPGFQMNELLQGQLGYLHLAAMTGDVGVLRVLLDAGSDIDLVDAVHGWTALMHAVHQGHEAAARLLLDEGANVDVTGTDLSTAAILARFSGLDALFVPPDADVAASPSVGRQRLDELLLRASEVGDIELVVTLLDQGADVNAVSPAGWTPLMYAALRSDRELYGLLRQSGGIPDAGQAVSVIQAAVLGAATNTVHIDESRDFIRYLLQSGEADSNPEYELLAEQLGLPTDLRDVLAQSTPVQYVQPFSIREDMNRDEWQSVQRVLSEMGLYTSTIDGLPGAATRGALLTYFVDRIDDIESGQVYSCSPLGDWQSVVDIRGVSISIGNLVLLQELIEEACSGHASGDAFMGKTEAGTSPAVPWAEQATVIFALGEDAAPDALNESGWLSIGEIDTTRREWASLHVNDSDSLGILSLWESEGDPNTLPTDLQNLLLGCCVTFSSDVNVHETFDDLVLGSSSSRSMPAGPAVVHDAAAIIRLEGYAEIVAQVSPWSSPAATGVENTGNRSVDREINGFIYVAPRPGEPTLRDSSDF